MYCTRVSFLSVNDANLMNSRSPRPNLMKNFLRQTPSATVALLGWLAVAAFSILDLATPVHAATPGSIQFAEPNYTVSEAAGTVTLVATRLGGSDGEVAGYYKTADGTALANQDYRPITNYVSWAAGDAAAKNIAITVINNTNAESSETFTVTFVAASGGATLGTPATATVTITDDDTAVVNHGTIQFAEANYTVSEAAGTVTLVPVPVATD